MLKILASDTSLKLRVLDNSRNKLPPSVAFEIAKMSSLRTLNILRNHLYDYGAVAIAVLKSLSSLDISGNYLTKMGAASLPRCLLSSLLALHTTYWGTTEWQPSLPNSPLSVLWIFPRITLKKTE